MVFQVFVCELCVKGKSTYRTNPCKCLIFNVIRAGFEPTTHSLEGCCSIQLSYETIFQKKVLQKYVIFYN